VGEVNLLVCREHHRPHPEYSPHYSTTTTILDLASKYSFSLVNGELS
jgi:hypothetical protein